MTALEQVQSLLSLLLKLEWPLKKYDLCFILHVTYFPLLIYYRHMTQLATSEHLTYHILNKIVSSSFAHYNWNGEHSLTKTHRVREKYDCRKNKTSNRAISQCLVL